MTPCDRAAGVVEAGAVHEVILLVDDETALQELWSKFMQREGYRALTAASGEEALVLFDEAGDSIGLVVLDLHMPGMGGEACLRALRERSRRLPVIVATGQDEGVEVAALSAHGVQAVIHKPFQLIELLRTVRRVFEQS